MEMVTFRIPHDLRQEMRQMKINWSEYVRQAISEAVESQRKRRLIRAVQQAVSPKRRVPTGTAAAIIRTMRTHA